MTETVPRYMDIVTSERTDPQNSKYFNLNSLILTITLIYKQRLLKTKVILLLTQSIISMFIFLISET